MLFYRFQQSFARRANAKLTRRRKRRDRSELASAGNGAVGGRVQRLVRQLVGDFRANFGRENTNAKCKTSRPENQTPNRSRTLQVLAGRKQALCGTESEATLLASTCRKRHAHEKREPKSTTKRRWHRNPKHTKMLRDKYLQERSTTRKQSENEETQRNETRENFAMSASANQNFDTQKRRAQAAERQAQLPLTAGTKLAETDKMNIAVSGQLQRFVM